MLPDVWRVPQRLPHWTASFSQRRDSIDLSDQQMAELYERLVAAKSKRVTPDRVFLRGWNAAIDFVVKQMRAVCDEPERENAE